MQDCGACYTAGMTIAALALAASLGYVPGDGIKSVRITLAPLACSVRFVDEGVAVETFGYGAPGLAMYKDAVQLVRDQPVPAESGLVQCIRAAKETCGAAGVKSVSVTDTSCSFECYPPPITPAPPANPPPATTGSAGGR